MPHMIYLMSPNQNFVNFPLRNFTSFSSQRITRFWIGDENIPLLSFPKKCVSRNGFHMGSFLSWNFTEWGNKSNKLPFLAGAFLKNVVIVGCYVLPAMIMYENFLIYYHKTTKVRTVKTLCNTAWKTNCCFSKTLNVNIIFSWFSAIDENIIFSVKRKL